MKINEYLKKEKISISKMAKAIDENEVTIAKWLYNGSIPSKVRLLKIYNFSNGKVQPNDFFGVDEWKLDGEGN